MKLATLLPVQRLCALAKVSHAGFYRWRHAPPAADADVDLGDEIQRVALEWPCDRSRRGKAERRRRGWAVGRERVQRLLREDNLLGLRRRKFVMTPTLTHNRRVYPNVACDLVLGDINQLWVADIT
jgi:transposase InsO family protein